MIRRNGSASIQTRRRAVAHYIIAGLSILLSLGPSANGEQRPLAQSPEGCYCVGTVGNVDCDYRDEISLHDVVVLIDHLFISGRRLPNLEEANVNGDPLGEISIADVTMLIDYLFVTGPSVVLPDCPQPFNSPPQTRIVNFMDTIPFVNGVHSDGSPKGIRMNWQGSDVVDHPYDPPAFEFEWKLFGPYTDAEYAEVLDAFLVPVFITNEAHVFRFGQPPQTIVDTFWNPSHTVIDSIRSRLFWTSLIVCDTSWWGGSGYIVCDTIPIDMLTSSNIYGTLDTLLCVYDDDFINSPYYIVADSSHDDQGNVWTTELRDSIFDVYRNHPSDTTQTSRFIFVVRSRDDGLRPDLTPAWKGLRVIDPKFERDFLIVDFAAPAAENGSKLNSVRTYWKAAIDSFRVQTGHEDVVFDPAVDLHHEQEYGSTYQREFLTDLLRHKVLIVFQDSEISGGWNSQQYGSKFFYVTVALQMGVNAWVTARVPIGNHFTGAPLQVHAAGANYQNFFGVQQYTFPGWSSTFYDDLDGCPRTDDFVGALSPDELGWPELAVDTALLRVRYRWAGANCHNPPAEFPFSPYMQSLGAIPQVGWAEPTPEAEILYTYKSLYGPVHPIDPNLSFESKPVMHRLDRGSFRTVHSVFTPLVLRQPVAQPMVDSVLNWLYDPPVSPGSEAVVLPRIRWEDDSNAEGRSE